MEIEKCTAENLTFAATLKSKNIKLFTSIIKVMSFIDNTEIQLSAAGFKYVVEESKSFQVTAYIKKEFFSEYILKFPKAMDLIGFGVNLTSFTDLLSAFLDNELGNMNISYYHRQNKLLFVLEQTDNGALGSNKAKQSIVEHEDEEVIAGKIITEYFLKTMHSVDPIDFTVKDPQTLSSLILDAPCFHSVLNDFDRTIDELEIRITQAKMTLRTVGVLQYGASAKFKCNSDIFNKFECTDPSKFSYNFKFFKIMLKGLALASKASIVTHADGLMKVQLMVRVDENQDSPAFLEYNMIPNLPDEDDD